MAGVDVGRLAAVSLGAVFLGAMTYIGNGPNFMVKAIAEQSGVRMPSFFGYCVYSFGVLLPVFILVSTLFL
jgi:Na+/H+ antiporter NhaD/arsenite permease-like protein